MDEKIEAAIAVLAGKITAAVQPDHALKYTQAALNLAQAALNLAQAKVIGEGEKKKRAGA